MAPRGVKVEAHWVGTLDADCRRKIDTMAARTYDVLDQLGSEGRSYAAGIAPVRTGAYRAGLTSRRDVQGRRIGVNVRSSAPHAAIVEKGRKPGKGPPAAVIMSAFGVDHRRAVLISRSIGAKGTKGAKVMAKTKRQLKGRLAVEGERLGQWLNDLDAH